MIKNILSLCDGLSGGQIALNKSNIHYDNYFSSEIDKYTIKITQENYPNTIQLGDMKEYTKWELPKIYLLLCGSPCQGFSIAGKGLNFRDKRSKLFFTFVDILRKIKPKYFLFENVLMKQEYQDLISDLLGCKPIKINSALVSAQNRKRLYWTNIPSVCQPENKNILLKDIIEDGFTDREKSHCIDANYSKGGNLKTYYEKSKRQLIFKNDLSCKCIGTAIGINGYDYLKRVYDIEGKSPTVVACSGGNTQIKISTDKTKRYRKLTPLECERLQMIPDNYTKGVSNTQRYKMIGNGWTIGIISHILNNIKRDITL